MTRPDSVTQMAFARMGEITEAMRFVAEREHLAPEVVREEVAAGRLVIPANVRHLAGSAGQAPRMRDWVPHPFQGWGTDEDTGGWQRRWIADG